MPVSKATSPRRKHIPQRMCAVCRETDAKRGLTRLVRLSEGPVTEAAAAIPVLEGGALPAAATNDGVAQATSRVAIDRTGKANGRGAYLCDKLACWKRAVETDVVAKALRMEFSAEDRQRLREAMTTMADRTKSEPRQG
jgi:hypothetical protein